jgi:Uncharacterized protein conserved in bacteria
MQPIKFIVNRVVSPAVKKRGFLNGRILLEWEQIVGPKFSQFTKPIKVFFRPGYRRYGVLHLAVSPSFALLVDHAKDLIIEQINSYFGYQAVSSLMLKQVPFTTPLAPSSRPLTKLDEEESAMTDGAPASVSDAIQQWHQLFLATRKTVK